ncbi:hypothetical protein Ae201684_008949 [Aphanomyces euteiches]|uniref:Sister chromatid cohesion protein n=1 Tax=Aphanomyces euteiches TaxID=100861 RepID=A0A6G0X3I6_9STRA|nr:hypothetical protein Ae201684_008949 [Aphanomyces euteiches]
MSKSLPLFVPDQEGESEDLSIWNLPPPPIAYNRVRSIDPSRVNTEAMHLFLRNVPESLLPEVEAPKVTWENMSPLLRAVVSSGPTLSPNVSRELTDPPTKKQKLHDEITSTQSPDKKPKRIKVIEIHDNDEDEQIPASPVAIETQESKNILLVHKYQDELQGLVAQLSTTPDVPRITKKIMQTLQLLHKSHKKLIRHISYDLLTDLMSVLDARVAEALTIDLFVVACADSGDADWESSGIDFSKLEDLVCAMDAASCMLYVITSPNIDRRLLSEEAIDHCVSLLKHVLQRLVFPSLDPVSLNQLLHDMKLTKHPKYHGSLKKKIEKAGLVHVTSAFMETMETLVADLKLQDCWILALSSVLVGAFALEGSQATQSNISLLQVRASLMCREIFLHYPPHRSPLLDDIFSVFLKLPTSKRNLRTYSLSHGDSQVQMISMLLVTLAQSSIQISLDGVRETAKSIVHCFVQKCMKKEEDHDFRQKFENFVDDLLAMMLFPEWPAVEVILMAVSGGLTNLMVQQKSSKLESQSSLLALHLLGKICASIRQVSCEARDNPICEVKRPPALIEFREYAVRTLSSKDIETSPTNIVQMMVLMYLSDAKTHIPVDAEPFHQAKCSFSEDFVSLKANMTVAGSIVRQLMIALVAKSELCQHFDQMLMAIMAFLSRGQPTFRARVLKALGLIVDSDPMLMADDHFQKAITVCLMDEATSVRQSAVELVGKYVGMQPSLFATYYPMLADRLRDKGISVRKSALKIFRVYLQSTPIEPEASEWISKALRALVERIGVASEEESVKETVLTTIQEIWFGAPQEPNRRKSNTSEATVTPASLKKKSSSNHKILSVIDVVHHVSNSEWIVSLITRLMKKNDSQINTACAAMVSELMELLLLLEEKQQLKYLSFQDEEAQRVATFKTLHIICEASPELVLPYFETLTIYLQPDDSLNKRTQMQILAIATSTITLVFPLLKRFADSKVSKLEADLKKLVLGAPPQVVKPAVKCLATIAESTNRPPKLLLEILEGLYVFLVKTETLVKLDKPISEVPKLLRSLFVAGLVAGSLDWGSLQGISNSVLPQPKLVEMVYDVYARYAKVPSSHQNFNVALRVKTVQGFGYLFHRNPRILLKAQQDNTLKLTILHSDANVRTQILASLTELLQAEEARLEKLHETQLSTQSREHVQGDQEGEASYIGSVMQAQLQNILKAALQKEASIRSQAISCLGLLLTQGLVAPMQCISTLVALETDHIATVRDAAYMHLVGIHEKFPTMVSGPAIQGIYSSYQFQMRAFGKCTVCDEDGCFLGRVYRACIQGNSSQRNSFFNGLLNVFREKGPIFTALADQKIPPVMALGYLSYVAQILSVLPYDVEDEPLFIVYTINREVSLTLGAIQDKMQKVLGREATFDNMPVSEPWRPELTTVGHAAFATALLIRLKLALKEAYNLDNEKCQTFQTTKSTKANEVPVTRAKENIVLDLNDMLAEEDVKNGWMHLTWLGNAAKTDQAQLDFDFENPQMKKKPKSKRCRKRKEKKDEEDEEPVDEVF